MAASIYLDYNAATPLAPNVAEAMRAGDAEGYFNPERQHQFGQRARRRRCAATLRSGATAWPKPSTQLTVREYNPGMNQPFQAKFEHGHFRPLEPIDLADDTVVSLVVVATEPVERQDVSARQRAALASFLEKAKSIQANPPDDDLTNRDHDRIIYGT